METLFILPTRPYSVIDAINRSTAATGSVRYAQLTAHANYNGHSVGISWNSYRGYWITEYFWGERVVLSRGNLEGCLRAAREYYDRGDLGAAARVRWPTRFYPGDHQPEETIEDFERLCRAAGFTDQPEDRSWFTDMHREVPNAISWERHGLGPAVSYLANSKTMAEYQAKLDAYSASVREARHGA